MFRNPVRMGVTCITNVLLAGLRAAPSLLMSRSCTRSWRVTAPTLQRSQVCSGRGLPYCAGSRLLKELPTSTLLLQKIYLHLPLMGSVEEEVRSIQETIVRSRAQEILPFI